MLSRLWLISTIRRRLYSTMVCKHVVLCCVHARVLRTKYLHLLKHRRVNQNTFPSFWTSLIGVHLHFTQVRPSFSFILSLSLALIPPSSSQWTRNSLCSMMCSFPLKVENCRTILHDAGFKEVHERDPFDVQPGGYV